MSRWLPYAEVHGPEHTVSGEVVVWPELASPQLGGSREIAVYLPPSLAAGSDKGRRYPVLYFNDGQNVFDDHTSYVGEWHADEVLEMLAGEGIEAIAVAVPHGTQRRMDEYNPWRGRNPRHWLRRPTGGKGDDYLAFLVDSVRPLVDRSFPTRRKREATAIVGSSMGGLISLYGLLARGDVFGLAGVMSPAIFWSDYRILGLIEERGLPPARIHLDVGGREGGGMLRDARRLRDALVAHGCVLGRDLHYVEEPDAAHNESAWTRRLPDALRFLLRDTRDA